MLIIIAFVVINCVIAIFLEHKKLRTASIAHAVLFSLLLLLLLCTSGASYVNAVVDCAMDTYSKTLITGAFIHSDTIIAPSFVVEIVVLALVLIASAITVATVAESLNDEQLTQLPKHNAKTICHDVTSADEVFHSKKYIQKCSYIC